MLRPGDGVAVHNPTGWMLPYAEVRLLTGRRVDVVDARDGRRVPTQERRIWREYVRAGDAEVAG